MTIMERRGVMEVTFKELKTTVGRIAEWVNVVNEVLAKSKGNDEIKKRVENLTKEMEGLQALVGTKRDDGVVLSSQEEWVEHFMRWPPRFGRNCYPPFKSS
jgi:hypothetical protein